MKKDVGKATDFGAPIGGLPATSGTAGVDLDSLRLSQDFESLGATKKRSTTVPVRKPNPQEFIRTHPNPDFTFNVNAIEVKDEREIYVVDRALSDRLSREITARVLVLYVNRQGDVGVWPLRKPAADGRRDGWAESAMEAATIARTRWVRVVSNLRVGAYEVYEAVGSLAEPEWPEEDFEEILRIAFKDRVIRDLDHPVIRRLQGT